MANEFNGMKDKCRNEAKKEKRKNAEALAYI